MPVARVLQFDGFKAPAGPPLGRQGTLVIVQAALVGGQLDENLSAVIPDNAAQPFVVGCRLTDPPGINATQSFHVDKNVGDGHWHLIVQSANFADGDSVTAFIVW